MHIRQLFFAFLLIGCAPNLVGVGPWEYRSTNSSGCSYSPPDSVAMLIRRAETDFDSSPAYPDNGRRPVSVNRVAHCADGRTLIAFSIGGVEDTLAIYIFDAQGEIVDRYLHSFWGN